MRVPKEEIWAWIPGYEGEYEVSTKGRVRSHVGRKPRFLSHINKNGWYKNVTIGGRNRLIHRLVLTAHKRQPFPIEVANHLNGDKSDNRIENLVWCTPRENVEHSIRLGLSVFVNGERQGHSILTEKKVIRIKKILKKKKPFKEPLYSEIGKRFGVEGHVIRKIACGVNWKHITLAEEEKE